MEDKILRFDLSGTGLEIEDVLDDFYEDYFEKGEKVDNLEVTVLLNDGKKDEVKGKIIAAFLTDLLDPKSSIKTLFADYYDKDKVAFTCVYSDFIKSVISDKKQVDITGYVHFDFINGKYHFTSYVKHDELNKYYSDHELQGMSLMQDTFLSNVDRAFLLKYILKDYYKYCYELDKLTDSDQFNRFTHYLMMTD